MAKPMCIELGEEVSIPILYEDRSVLAIDKPAHWMLVPYTWDRTDRNLQLAITSSILGGEFWARSRNLRFLRHIHRLDAETTGILLFGKSPGAVQTFSQLFQSRQMEKVYLAVAEGKTPRPKWACSAPIAPDPQQYGRMRLDARGGKDAETAFTLLATHGTLHLIEARPLTGRTHQIRLHLLDAGLRILGEPMYGSSSNHWKSRQFPMALRASRLEYRDPFTRKPIRIRAPEKQFLETFGFASPTPPATSATGDVLS
jgi:23S rRNA pseudouridine1911/1915/1917 synthase